MTELILLPGTLCDERLFAHQIEHLADVASVEVGDITTADTITGMATAVLDRAPPRFALAGFSLGGIVAIEIMRIASERISKLALLDTNHNPPTVSQVTSWELFEELTRTGRFEDVTRRYLLDTLLHDRTPESIALVLDMAAGVGPESFLIQNAAQLTRPDNRPVLPTISASTLVLCGREERVCPVSVHEALAAAIPGARLVVIPGAGHLSTIDQPELVTQAMRSWLAASAQDLLTTAETKETTSWSI
ncbi:MAG: alpha/beta fold hydrolase [Acidobacteria bacterium]|nr:alpha/beta fold hydrolase [Acidobacteriota bacterium]